MRLQRGPGYFARESLSLLGELPAGATAASKRPRLFRPGKHWLRWKIFFTSSKLQRGPGYFARESDHRYGCSAQTWRSFKEAQAISPGKVHARIARISLLPSFKEAQAISPGKDPEKTNEKPEARQLQRGPGYFARESASKESADHAT